MTTTKDVLVTVDAGLWQRVKERAVTEQRYVKDVVGNALRMYLSQSAGGGVVPSGSVTQGPPAAERTAEDLSSAAVAEETTSEKATRLRRLMDGVTGRPTDPLHGIPEAIGTSEDFPLTSRVGDYLGQPRESDAERERRQRRDRLRTHPEDESQDPSGEDSR